MRRTLGFSALQRAEIAEIRAASQQLIRRTLRFSALQRAEIAEIRDCEGAGRDRGDGFSALQRAEIAEMLTGRVHPNLKIAFQCSSTSRNC